MFIATGTLVLAANTAPQAMVRYDGYSIVRADIDSRDEFERATAISDRLLSEMEGRGRLDFLVAPGAQAMWALSGLPHEFVVDDLQTKIEVERERISAYQASGSADFYAEYQPLDALYTYIDDLAAGAGTRVVAH